MVTTILLFCILIGVVAGMRALTAPAVVCWGAHLGWLHLAGTKLAFLGAEWALILFTVLAVVELITDQLPKTPARTVPPQVSARVLFGALCGWALAIAVGGSALLGAGCGIIGALIGTYGGYHTRHALVTKAGLPDFVVAVAEDLIAILGGLFLVSHV
jgi:uncharacterized membrane protein